MPPWSTCIPHPRHPAATSGDHAGQVAQKATTTPFINIYITRMPGRNGPLVPGHLTDVWEPPTADAGSVPTRASTEARNDNQATDPGAGMDQLPRPCRSANR